MKPDLLLADQEIANLISAFIADRKLNFIVRPPSEINYASIYSPMDPAGVFENFRAIIYSSHVTIFDRVLHGDDWTLRERCNLSWADPDFFEQLTYHLQNVTYIRD